MRFRTYVAALAITVTVSIAALGSPSTALADDAQDSVAISNAGIPTVTVGLPDDSNGSTNTVIRGTDSTQLLITIADADAPTRYIYPVDVLGGGTVELLQDGAIAHDSSNNTVAVVQAPWAHDADGKNVPTHFETDGTALAQVVDHTAGSYSYPITADPFWSTAWKVTVCGAAIAAVVGVSVLAVQTIAAWGGPVMAAQLLIAAGVLRGGYDTGTCRTTLVYFIVKS